MGHFTHNCKLTGVPIRGNATIIVMRPRKNLYDNSHESLMKYGKSSMISNEGPRLKFIPVWFPIHGKYDDYGGMDDIIEDDNTKVLESYYGLTIQELVNVVTSGRKDDGYDGNLSVIKEEKVYPSDWIEGEKHFMYYQRKTEDFAPNGGRYPMSPNNTLQIFRDGKYILSTQEEYDADFKLIHDHYKRYQEWTKLNPDPEDDYKKPKYKERYVELLTYSVMWVHGDVYKRLTDNIVDDDYDRLDLGTPELLVHLGFKSIGKSPEGGRYNCLFEKEGLVVNSDDTWLNVPGEQIYTLKGFKKYCAKKGVDIDISNLDGVGKVGQTYDLLLGRYKPKTNFDFLQNRRDSMISYYFLSGPYNDYGKPNPLTDHFVNEAIVGKLRDNLIRFWVFDTYLFAMGGYYEIVGTGPQDGEFKSVKKVLEIALEIVNEELKDYEEEEDEDEDYD